jgi:3-dehydroquinate synthase
MDFLKTLPDREFRIGLSEIIKYGIIDDSELFSQLEKEVALFANRNPDLFERFISKSGRIKKGIVEIDENEHGLRRILNFGHTLGHAIEAESQYQISHGDAVAIGMVGAAMISEKLKYLSASERSRIQSLIQLTGLPSHLPDGISPEGVLSRMKMDKKKEGDKVHFVLIKRIGVPFVNGSIPDTLIRETLEGLRA